MKLIVVLCTFPDRETARRVGAALIEARLAACVSLCPAVESIYRWQGKVERAEEILAVIKTTQAGFAALEERLRKLHPYEVPEIMAVPVTEASADYAAWLDGAVARAGA